MKKIWDFLRDPENRGALGLIGAVIVGISIAGWNIVIHRQELPSLPQIKESLGTPQSETKCKSPSDYVRRVFSKNGETIKYKLESKDRWSKMQVVFFGEPGVVLRNNTVLLLTETNGTLVVPEDAIGEPKQRWFNFLVTRPDGCEQWGLVAKQAIDDGLGNIIRISSPSGEGLAFEIPPARPTTDNKHVPLPIPAPFSPPKPSAPFRPKASLQLSAIDESPKQLTVSASVWAVSEGDRLWIGVLSENKFYPQIEIPSRASAGDPLQYRITIPSAVTSGAVVLISAGPESNKLLSDTRTGQHSDIGIFLPHRSDMQVIRSADIPYPLSQKRRER